MSSQKLKYPLILVHGIGAKDHSFFWGRIPNKLRAQGIKLYLGNTDSWGCIENNALSLKQSVDSVLESCDAEKVNIIAHSKGGLDSRFLISSLGYGDRIASLTTISTPHHGAEIANLLFEKKPVYNPVSKKIINSVIKIYGDRSPDPYAIISELTTGNMKLFNQNNPDDRRVYYSSYHSVMKHFFDDLSHSFSFEFLKRRTGENDGIVSLKSARWGNDFTLIQGRSNGISHSEIIDIKRKTISGIDIPGEYLKIVEKLAAKGY